MIEISTKGLNGSNFIKPLINRFHYLIVRRSSKMFEMSCSAYDVDITKEASRIVSNTAIAS
jgi:hypothetical protein